MNPIFGPGSRPVFQPGSNPRAFSGGTAFSGDTAIGGGGVSQLASSPRTEASTADPGSVRFGTGGTSAADEDPNIGNSPFAGLGEEQFNPADWLHWTSDQGHRGNYSFYARPSTARRGTMDVNNPAIMFGNGPTGVAGPNGPQYMGSFYDPNGVYRDFWGTQTQNF